MSMVKGTILVDFVKTIKADKSGGYERFLTDDDREIVDSRILSSRWYPYDTFKRCFAAAVENLAGNNMDSVRQWGRLYGETIIKSVYKGLIREGEPLDALSKYRTHVRNLFDEGDIEVQKPSEGKAEMVFTNFDPDFEPLYHIMRGWVERSLELCGAKNISSEFVQKSWEGDPQTVISLTWEL